MPMDDYDTTVSKFDYIIDVYQNDNIQQIISDFLNNVSISKHKIEVRYQELSQFKEDEYLSENITNTVYRLRNALDVLESRIITNIGGKIAYHIVPEKWDPDIGYRVTWILIQVYRGYRHIISKAS